MAMRYGIPVSEFLRMHTSAELTELKACLLLQNEPQSTAPLARGSPAEQAALLKQALFKGKT
jgi:hypothetical protein